MSDNIQVSISLSKLKDVIERFPRSRAAIEYAFPIVKDIDPVFCKIGSVLKRYLYANVYVVTILNQCVVVIDITRGEIISPKRSIPIDNLKDKLLQSITVSEFKYLTSNVIVNAYKIIDIE